MKNHFITLFGPAYRKTTLVLLIIGLLLISISLSLGISDNLPAIAILFVGIMVFCFSILHTWKKATYYATLVGVCGTILPLIWGNHMMGEDIDFALGGICAAGIFAGTIGFFMRLLLQARNKLR
jgi:hypothetical protein